MKNRRPNVSSTPLLSRKAVFIPSSRSLHRLGHLTRSAPTAGRVFQSPAPARLAFGASRDQTIRKQSQYKNPFIAGSQIYSPSIFIGDREKSVCEQRQERRETMFAQGSAGRGYRTRKDNSQRGIKC
jgi:hypothetical protein